VPPWLRHSRARSRASRLGGTISCYFDDCAHFRDIYVSGYCNEDTDTHTLDFGCCYTDNAELAAMTLFAGCMIFPGFGIFDYITPAISSSPPATELPASSKWKNSEFFSELEGLDAYGCV
jgi:hypothetical protein